MYIQVMEFNKERNKLELDMKLELNMLREEIREFWEATTVAERLDAFIDVEYVWIGTQIKASYNTFAIPDELTNSIKQSLGVMGDILAEELGMHMSECYHKARNIVCDCNQMKGKDRDKEGKVIKDSHVRDATKEIALMIEAITKPKEY